jgi:hypothetical protein
VSWLLDVCKAVEVVKKGKFAAVTHGGIAHMDDTLAAALLFRHGAEVYRYNTLEEVLKVDGDVVLFDIGDAFRDKLPERYVVLDHHGVKDPSEEPSSIIQVSLALDAKYSPQVATLVHFVDLFDRYGPAAKRWAGPYGNSLNNGVARYFGEATPTGLVKEVRFLELLAEALASRQDFELSTFAEAYKLAERLPYVNYVDKFPRTFQNLRLMLSAVEDPIGAAMSKEAQETGFGIDFGAYAVMAVPELEPYVLKGLEGHFAEAKKPPRWPPLGGIELYGATTLWRWLWKTTWRRARFGTPCKT